MTTEDCIKASQAHTALQQITSTQTSLILKSTTMQRPPTDSSAGGLVGDPLLITAHKNLLAEVLTQDSEGSGNSTPPSSSAEAGEVADVVAQSCLQSHNFWTVGEFAGLPKRPLMTLPPGPPKSA